MLLLGLNHVDGKKSATTASSEAYIESALPPFHLSVLPNGHILATFLPLTIPTRHDSRKCHKPRLHSHESASCIEVPNLVLILFFPPCFD
jgi:hypothetical protein